ncbi:MAG: SurA N-terminal domain-containing protein [Proteobacteria bacterium]|nr:SurA N-terminal domain-containing protein [Pseudomonadota bacterium]
MLNTFRNNKKSIIGIVIAGFMAISMIGFGMNARTGGGRNGAEDAIRIGSHVVTSENYYNKLEQISQIAKYQFGQNFESLRTVLNLEQRAIDETIKEYILKNLISKLGLTASTAQIENYIQGLPFFKKFGFNKDTYNSFLAAQRLSGETLEEQSRLTLASQQLESLLIDLNLPSKEELVAIYNAQNTVSEISYVTFMAKDFENKIDKNDSEKLKKYFADFSEKYKKPRTIKYSFVKFDPKDFTDKVGEISEIEIEDVYNQRKSLFTEPKEMKLREIVVKKATDQASEVEKLITQTDQSTSEAATEKKNEALKENTKKIVERLKNGEDFISLAKQLSEDKTTAANGGDKGWQKLAAINKEVLRVVERVEKGKFSDVIETDDSFIIAFVDDIKEKRLKDISEVKSDIVSHLKEVQAPEYAKASAEDLFQKFYDSNTTLSDFATKNNLTLNNPNKFFTATDDLQESSGLTAKIVNFTKGEKQLITVGEMSYIVDIAETKDAYIPTLEEVKDEVTKDFVKHQSIELAKEAANKFLADAKNATLKANAIDDIAKANALKIDRISLKKTDKTTEAFLSSYENRKSVLALTLDNPLAQNVLTTETSFYVAQLKNKILPDQAEVEGKLSELREEQKSAFSNRFSGYILETLKAEANVWVNPKLLEKTAGSYQL